MSLETTMTQVGELVWHARKGQGMTQEALSRRCGIAQADISRIENGKSNITIGTLVRLADAMGVEFSMTMNETPEDAQAAAE